MENRVINIAVVAEVAAALKHIKQDVVFVDGASDDTLVSILGGAIDGATKATKGKLTVLLQAILKNEGKRIPDDKEATKLGSERTMERYVEQLREAGFIEFKRSAAQTGGYFITNKLKSIIK